MTDLLIYINGGLLLMFLFKWRAVIYLCMYLKNGLFFIYLNSRLIY